MRQFSHAVLASRVLNGHDFSICSSFSTLTMCHRSQRGGAYNCQFTTCTILQVLAVALSNALLPSPLNYLWRKGQWGGSNFCGDICWEDTHCITMGNRFYQKFSDLTLIGPTNLVCLLCKAIICCCQFLQRANHVSVDYFKQWLYSCFCCCQLSKYFIFANT